MIMNNRFEKGETPIENVNERLDWAEARCEWHSWRWFNDRYLYEAVTWSPTVISRETLHIWWLSSRNQVTFIGFTSKCLAIDEISFRNCTKLCKRRVLAEKSEIVLWVVLKLCKFALKVIKLNQVLFIFFSPCYVCACLHSILFQSNSFLSPSVGSWHPQKNCLPLLPRTRVQ